MLLNGNCEKPVHAISRIGDKLFVLHDIGNLSALYLETHVNGIDNHVLILVRHIVRFDLKIRNFHIAKIWNVCEKDTLLDSS